MGGTKRILDTILVSVLVAVHRDISASGGNILDGMKAAGRSKTKYDKLLCM